MGSDFAGIKYFKDLQDLFNLFYLYLNFHKDDSHVRPHYRYCIFVCFLFSFYSLFNYIPQDLDLVDKLVVDKLDLDDLDTDLELN